ncbi:epoxyqueuosine reductase [Pectinatus haikarae]|uniref:Epoxyqueuosine reductase QueG n=1 Tax=Pectinatus haikarae TaxID=349096 RepID=A0ABT9YAE3_9FIRM|nr:epoxyqueuosine reductase [Pectinatus haikarae]MDQ0204817.1 epoxyqueuosine reductase QueG [Pectinatus haikarae]
MKLSHTIEKIVRTEVTNNFLEYREPIIGYAAADDPLYATLDDKIGARQFHPKEMLPDAKTVIVYFIPFPLSLIHAIRQKQHIVPMWSQYYDTTNELLEKIGKNILIKMSALNIKGAMDPPTENFDSISLTGHWAHKASAVIAGIGTFGLNHLLITRLGTAGRLGSVIINAAIPPSTRPSSSYCLYYKSGKCRVCAEKCPSGALTEEFFDRFRCNAYLDGKNIRDDQQGCPVCSSGPCADKGF